MAYAAEFLVARLNEQIEMAQRLEMNLKPGGRIDQIIDKVKEGINLSGSIPVLRGVQGGSRRYVAHFSAALAKLEPLVSVFDEIASVKGAKYEDGEQRGKAMSRMKGKSDQIVSACKEAIGELNHALAVIEEGEKVEAKVGVK